MNSIYETEEKISRPDNGLFVTPPIFKKTVRLSDVKEDDNTPGDISVAPESGELLKTFYVYQGFTSYIQDAFSHFTKKRIPKQMERLVSLQDAGYLNFYGAHFIGRPMIEVKNSKPRPFLPFEARDLGEHYLGRIITNVEILGPDGKTVIDKREGILAGKVPIMLGSSQCHLSDPKTGKIDDPKLVSDYHECLRDAFGYFIVKGMEKMLLLQERLRKNMILTIMKVKQNKSSIITKITCDTDVGSREIWIIEENKALRASILSIFPQQMWDNKDAGKKRLGIPIFVLFRYILNNDMTEEQIFKKYFSPFIRKNENKIWLFLFKSREESKSENDIVRYIEDNIRLRDEQVVGIGKERSRQIREIVTRELFPHMIFGGATMTLTERKLYQFAIMIIKMSKYMIGEIKLDDWNNWGLKRVDSAAVIIEQLFTEIVDVYTRGIATVVKETFLTDPKKILDLVADYHTKMTELFIKSFSSNKWGTSRNPRENVVEQLKRETMLASHTQLTRINAPTTRKAKQASIRQIQTSQLGYICPADSPEGPSCGLVKAVSITASLTIHEESPRIMRVLSEKCGMYDEKGKDICMYNGVFMGWCVAEDLKDILIRLRRSIKIPKHTCIYVDSIGILGIWTDGSRLVRPLLIVDEYDTLVISKPLRDEYGNIIKPNMWDEDMDTLLEHGAVEYIDVLEQQTIVIAQAIDDLLQEKKEYKHALQAAKSAIDEEKSLLEPNMIDDLRGALENRETSLRVKKRLIEMSDTFSPEAAAAARKTANALDVLNGKINRRYTHCEYDPVAIFGIAASVIPFIGHTQAPRNTYQCAMGKQALGIYSSSVDSKLENMKTLAFPSRPQITTTASELLGLSEDPSGQNVIVALLAYEGYNQEDGLILNKQSIERGMFTTVIYHLYKTICKRASGNMIEKFERYVSGRRDEQDYHALDSTGIPRMGTYVKSGDCIIGKIRKNSSNKTNSHIYDVSVYVKPGQEGMVDKVTVSSPQGSQVVSVRIRQVKVPDIGDKFALRYAQKSTVVKIMDTKDMPFTIINNNVVKRFEESGPFGLPKDADDAELVHRFINILDEDGGVALRTGETGIVIREDTKFSAGDCLIAKGDESIYAKFDGYVMAVNEVSFKEMKELDESKEQKEMDEFQIKEREKRKESTRRFLQGGLIRLKVSYKIGDKTLIPDVMVSPASIPSRMTIGLLIELLLSLIFSITGQRISADAFRKYDLNSLRRILRDYGYNTMGWHKMVNGITGIVMNAEIFIEPAYYQTLRHLVQDKFQYRGTGTIKAGTRQPTHGRRKLGGQRWSQMSGVAMISHGVPAVLQDRSCISSDQQETILCRPCSIIGTAVSMTEFSTCSACGGKDFVKLHTGFSFILFQHLLTGLFIKTKLGFRDIPK
uniref:DNA-directed RNA polymerase n=1 Tax=Pithovirus LCPAC403 TaxID=2506596 RepID=A0A481ZDC6_9VIRU|nr:MAG: DNA-directed RNA polymerase subunit beta [Pithovirus LCPAC403]